MKRLRLTVKEPKWLLEGYEGLEDLEAEWNVQKNILQHAKRCLDRGQIIKLTVPEWIVLSWATAEPDSWIGERFRELRHQKPKDKPAK